MKKILGLDIGTNSIGWALIERDFDSGTGRIIKMGSRIIPTDPDLMSKYEAGQPASKNANRRQARGARRLRQRYKLRRQRLVTAMKELGWFPADFEIDTQNQKSAKSEIPVSQDALNEMRNILGSDQISADWVVYYLRAKALKERITPAELAMVLYHMNQRRGFKSNRKSGQDPSLEQEDQDAGKPSREKLVEIVQPKRIQDTGEKNKGLLVFEMELEDGRIGTINRKVLPDWVGKEMEMEITTIRNKSGETRLEFRQLTNTDKDLWAKQKVAREMDIKRSGCLYPGAYYFHELSKNKDYRIKDVSIDRSFYIHELKAILEKQLELNPGLCSLDAMERIAAKLYPKNDAKRKEIAQGSLQHLFIQDIVYYQRPLKSKKSSIADCRFETKNYVDPTTRIKQPLKAAPVSSPVFQEFRLWQTVNNIRITQRETREGGKLQTDVDVSDSYFTENTAPELYRLLDGRDKFSQKQILKFFNLSEDTHAINLFRSAEDKELPGNETKAAFRRYFKKAGLETLGEPIFQDSDAYEKLWHIFYSLDDKAHVISALKRQFGLTEEQATIMAAMPAFKSAYTSMSTKCLKRLLPLMRKGDYWSWEAIDAETKNRLQKIFDGEYDAGISDHTRELFQKRSIHGEEDCSGFSVKMAEYAVYGPGRELNLAFYDKPEHVVPAQPLNLRNPIVEQVVNETLRVVKDIWKEYGRPFEIHLELARELKKNAAEREEQSKRIEDNRRTNERVAALLRELGIGNPNSMSDIEKLKLWEQQGDSKAQEEFRNLKFKRPSEPTRDEIQKYKLWAEQKFLSPYSGNPIPLNLLFTKEYEVDHIIPRSRYFDDSFENKVVVESRLNKEKGNRTAMEYIKDGSAQGNYLLEPADFEQLVTRYYTRKKKKLLLSEDVPEGFINRNLTDTRYIGKKLHELLSPVSENRKDAVIITNGSITSELKSNWGLGEKMKELLKWRFERLQEKTGETWWWYDPEKDANGEPTGRKILRLKGYEKRIDHRHHALDALVIACTTRSHIKYLNDLNAAQYRKQPTDDELKIALPKLLEANKDQYLQSRKFRKPWQGFVNESMQAMEAIVVSFKKNNRIMGRKANRNLRFVQDAQGNWVKKMVVNREKPSVYVRKSLHKATIVGKLRIQDTKTVSIKDALEDVSRIVEKEYRSSLRGLMQRFQYDKEAVLKHLKTSPMRDAQGNEVKKLEVYFHKEVFGNRVEISSGFDANRIKKIPDDGIQRELKQHLEDIAELNANLPPDGQIDPYSNEGIEMLNRKRKRPLVKVTTYEESSSKFEIRPGQFTEADKGTNLFFAIYVNKEDPNIRLFETIPLRKVIESRLNNEPLVSPKTGYSHFLLTPGDLVLVGKDSKNNERLIWKFVSSTGKRAYFIPHTISKMIAEKKEFSELNKVEFDDAGNSIKQICIKLHVDRIGVYRVHDEENTG
jgi:CRISPR-associated endonuclease Csn1